MNTSNWTGRAPRTLEDAFGPSVRDFTESQPFHKSDRIVMWGCAAAVVAFIVIALVWGLPS